MANSYRAKAGTAILGLAAPVLAVLSGCAPDGAQSPGPEISNQNPPVAAAVEAAPVSCDEVSIHCGNTPSLTIENGGRLWAAFEQDGHAYLTYSDDTGASFSTPVLINPDPEAIETNGEGRPKVAVGPEGTIYVSWTRKLEGMFTGEIRFSRSVDGGTSFEPVRTVNDDGLTIGHRFDSLFVDPEGHVYMAWVDKRDAHAARTRGEEYRGAGLYYTVSTDRGASFAANRRVAEHACECCRIVAAPVPDGGAAVLWRHVFEPNIRDHAFAVLGVDGLEGPIERVSHEDWALDACPHHGPAITPAGPDGYHMTWFTGADDSPRIYYGLFHPASGETLHQREIASGANASHADIVMTNDRLTLAWKQATSTRTDIFTMTSTDGGRLWSDPRSIIMTVGSSDHPFLLADGDETYLAWHTAEEGLRILPVGSS